MDNTNTIIDVLNVLEYYGDIRLYILEEVLHNFPNTTGFTLYDKQYDITEKDLYSICTHWSKILRG